MYESMQSFFAGCADEVASCNLLQHLCMKVYIHSPQAVHDEVANCNLLQHLCREACNHSLQAVQMK